MHQLPLVPRPSRSACHVLGGAWSPPSSSSPRDGSGWLRLLETSSPCKSSFWQRSNYRLLQHPLDRAPACRRGREDRDWGRNPGRGEHAGPEAPPGRLAFIGLVEDGPLPRDVASSRRPIGSSWSGSPIPRAAGIAPLRTLDPFRYSTNAYGLFAVMETAERPRSSSRGATTARPGGPIAFGLEARRAGPPAPVHHAAHAPAHELADVVRRPGT